MRAFWLMLALVACGEPEAEGPIDADQDGTPAGEDCDDTDPSVTVGRPYYADADGDGHGASQSELFCALPEGYVTTNGDCDDANAARFPGAEEVCDGIDNDCDAAVDLSDPDTVDLARFYRDVDGDGHGDPDQWVQGCDAPTRYVAEGDDCDDRDAAVSPGAQEFCNGLDDDCDGLTDLDDPDATDALGWYLDVDGDGFGDDGDVVRSCAAIEGRVLDGGDCDDAQSDVHPAAVEFCNDVDDDCDGAIDLDDPDAAAGVRWFADGDADGWGDDADVVVQCEPVSGRVTAGGDCDDGDDAVSPGAAEVCDARDVDEDCDGFANDDDPTVTGTTTFFADDDADGWGDDAEAIEACEADDLATLGGDCDDGDAAVNPGAAEVWYDGVDADCDGASDFDQDADGREALSHGGDDCDDADPLAFPGAEEFVDGVDADCDGVDFVCGAVTRRVPDDYATIQGAVDEACDGDLVTVAAGTWSENVDLNGLAVTLAGEGTGLTTLLPADDTLPALMLDAATVRGLAVSGGAVSQPAAVVVEIGAGAVLEDVAIVDVGGALGLLVTGDATVRGLVVANAAQDGVYVDTTDTTTSLTLQNATVVGNGGAGVVLDAPVAPLLSNLLTAWNGGSGLELASGSANPSYSAFWSNGAADFTGDGTGVIAVDPGFVTFAPDLDPAKWDLRLAPGSALIDAGSPESTDPDGSAADIGAYGGDAASFDYYADGDGDGLYDGWEIRHALDASLDDSSGDPDGDGLDNAAELAAGTFPREIDTDGDGLIDGDEVTGGTDPLSPYSR